MRNADQISAVEEFLDKNPRSQMLSFYAGLTGLSNMEVLKSMTRAFHQAIGSEVIIMHLMQTSGDPQQKALACLNCLFESENESLLKSPLTDLPINKGNQQGIADLYQHNNTAQIFHSLSLHFLPLTPMDCLSLGVYIHAKSVSVTQQVIMAFDLLGCSIDNDGMRILFNELKRDIKQRTVARVQLLVAKNKFDKESLPLLKTLVQGQSNLEGLGLCNCFDPSVVDLRYALKCLIEGLSSNSSCRFIDLSANYLNSSHIHYIILMLRVCHQIYWMDLKWYDLSRVMPLFSRAVHMTTLFSLDVSNCNISDSDLVLLGQSIHNNCLHNLCIHGNPITHDGLSKFLQHFVNNHLSWLRFVGLDLSLNEEQQQMLQEINQFRSLLQHPPLTPWSYHSTQYSSRETIATGFLELFRHGQN